jgi:hypothetical protein
MSDIVWGDPIDANTQLDWLGDNELITVKWHFGEWSDITYGLPAVHWVHNEWEAFKLPANHPYYLATSTGFKYWPGGDRAPDDWDGGDVLLRDGDDTGSGEDWRHLGDGCDIIGYQPKQTNIPTWALTRADEIMGTNARDNLAKYVMEHEEEPEDPLLEIAQNIAADICDACGVMPEYSQFMREGAYNSDREVQIALAALKHGMEMR